MNNPLIQIPEQFRASHPILLQKIGKFFLTITGWKFKGDIPRSDRIILVAGPHTSNWDFLLALAFIFGLNFFLTILFMPNGIGGFIDKYFIDRRFKKKQGVASK